MPRKFPISPQPDESDAINYTVSNDLSRFTGRTLVVGDTVFLSDDGVAVLAGSGGAYEALNAYNFMDEGGEEIGGMYGRDDGGQNIIGLRVVDGGGDDDDTLLELASESGDEATASVLIQAVREGEGTDTYINLERGDAGGSIDILAPAGGRVRVGRRLNLLGPDAELCDIYIKDSYFILKYNDAGTTRYKYLDLSGTGSSWGQGTSEP